MQYLKRYLKKFKIRKVSSQYITTEDIENLSEEDLEEIKQKSKSAKHEFGNMSISSVVFDAIVLLREYKDELTLREYKTLKMIVEHPSYFTDSDSMIITRLRKKYLSES